MGRTKHIICALLLAGFFTSCPVADEFTELPWTYPPGVTNKWEYTNGKTVKVALSISGSEDPNKALRYRMGTNFGPYYFDYVVLCSAKMKKINNETGGFTFQLDDSEIRNILRNRGTMLTPLQSRGMKVLLQIENGGEGFTFANLPRKLRFAFALACKNFLEQYNLDGFEFNDVNGNDPVNGLYAYPATGGGATYYDGVFDDFPAYYENTDGDRLDIAAAVIPKDLREPTSGDNWSLTSGQKVDYFWLNGGYTYGVFLNYFRSVPVWQDPNQIGRESAIIGELADRPILVRETGFAAGRNGLRDVFDDNMLYGENGPRNYYLSSWIVDNAVATMDFTGIIGTVNVFMSNNAAPGFGWENTGRSIMNYADHYRYCPGILDLGTAVTDAEITAFSRRFANGNWDNNTDEQRDIPYTILYYSNVGNGADTADRLSITSRIVYGGRQEQDYELLGLLENGPRVVYTGN